MNKKAGFTDPARIAGTHRWLKITNDYPLIINKPRRLTYLTVTDNPRKPVHCLQSMPNQGLLSPAELKQIHGNRFIRYYLQFIHQVERHARATFE